MKQYLKDIKNMNYNIWQVFETEDVEILESIREINGKIIISQNKRYQNINIFRIEVDIKQYGYVITQQMYEERKFLDRNIYDIIYLKNYKDDYKILIKKSNQN